jgi:hypothetical protein
MSEENIEISCYCATYGRPKRLIENTIQCFLDQDWPGKKELIIFNDCKYQNFVYNHPEIKIINSNDRINNLGKKFNETIKLCSYNYLATWEDDDTFLRNRLSYSIKNLKNKAFHTYDAFIEKQEKIFSKSQGYSHSTHMFDRNLFESIGMYNETDTRDIDVTLMKKMSLKINQYSTKISNNKDIFYIYNWIQDSYHASSSNFEQHKISNTVEDMIKLKIDTGKLENGTIYLEPKLRYNFYEYIPA